MTTETMTRETVRRYEAAIAELDGALATADAARRALDRARRLMERREAEITLLGLPGKNEAERKAALVVALAADADHAAAVGQSLIAEQGVRESERDARILQERCRLFRAQLALHAAD